jgi:SAM-dependent methyltransferase
MPSESALHRLRLRLRPFVPRPYRPLATRALYAAGRIALRGKGAYCPCCDTSFRRFLAYPDPICPGCASAGRHRAVWLYLDRHPELMTPPPRTLHLAPERCLVDRLRDASEGYVSIDLERGRAQRVMDVMDLTFPDDSFGFILCSHVLGVVDDRQQAMRELARVLQPNGVAILLWPIRVDEAVPELNAAGFSVFVQDMRGDLDPAVVDSNGLFPAEALYICRKRVGALNDQ